ncbi:MAG TPA: hypothetical protein VF393_06395 [archaeon]
MSHGRYGEEKRGVTVEIAPEQFNNELMLGIKFVCSRVVDFSYRIRAELVVRRKTCRPAFGGVFTVSLVLTYLCNLVSVLSDCGRPPRTDRSEFLSGSSK